MANRISLKELSELLAKEVQNGNGDAFIFVGEYYITKDNYTEEIPQSYDVITGMVIDNTKVHEFPYIIYKDNITKEKIMATNYQHVQKLTEEENAELERQLKSDEFNKKSYGSKSKKSSNRYGSTYTTPEYYTFSGGTGITNRIAIEEDVVAPMGELQINGAEQVPVEIDVNAPRPANNVTETITTTTGRQNVREYINQMEQEYIRRVRR